MAALFDFLQKNQILKGHSLPLVHSTDAYYIKKFIRSGRLLATPCNVFKGENLSYFFVGRPAFKRVTDSEPQYWELPMCVIMEFSSFRPKRIFPFDSGAFRSNRYPRFINMMEISEFEASSDTEAAEKIIGTFFTSNRDYFNMKPRDPSSFEARFEVDILDEEIKALHKLINFSNDQIDDRRFTIEFQSDKDIMLNSNNVLAVVMPETYIESQPIVDYVTNELKAIMLTYPVMPLKKDYFYYAIYLKVDEFFRKEGCYRV